MILAKLGALLGGIGLFLLGMHLMTDGLKKSAGGALRNILDKGTSTLFRGILWGAVMTALVQSSSAVTVALIGFVNAGLMKLRQAVGVIYGSNIGTTMTGWLVALVGFNFDIKAVSLPLIGIGMGLWVVFGQRRQGAFGFALAGFGVFFIGIDVLNVTFHDLKATIELEALFRHGLWGSVLFVGIGFLLTMLMQSSSAAMAVSLTAASGGMIPLNAGAAMVIGANLGTTSTAALSVIGSTPNAKRVAGAHVVFNLLTGAAALVILPLFLGLLVSLRHAAGLENDPAPLLALFHTAFNLLGVLLMLPLTGFLVRFLNGRFRAADEALARPQYLDRNIVSTPSLALEALFLELGRIGDISRRMCRRTLGSAAQGAKTQIEDRRALESLIDAVGEFANQMRGQGMPRDLSGLLSDALRVSRYYTEAAELAENVTAARVKNGRIDSPELEQAIESFESLVDQLAEMADSGSSEYDPVQGQHLVQQVLEDYQTLKSRLLQAGADGLLPVRLLVNELDTLSNIRRIAEQLEKGSRYLAYLRKRSSPVAEDSKERENTSVS